MAYNGENKRRWYLSREISVEGIIAFFMALGAIVTAWLMMNERLGAVEVKQIGSDIQITARLNRIEDKLDRAIERKQ